MNLRWNHGGEEINWVLIVSSPNASVPLCLVLLLHKHCTFGCHYFVVFASFILSCQMQME